MKLETLKWLRLVTPGIMILLATIWLGKTTGFWDLDWPENLKNNANTTAVILLAGLYYLLPLREWSNRPYLSDVNDRLRARLVKVSGLEDDPKRFTWPTLRGIFYYLVDSDNALTRKSKLAYANSYLWSTFADLRAVSLLFVPISLVLGMAVDPSAYPPAATFAALFLLSFKGSAVTTRRHIAIGEDQVDVIGHFHRKKLRETLEAIPDPDDPEPRALG